MTTIQLINTYADLGSLWYGKPYKDSLILRMSQGVCSVDRKTFMLNWSFQFENEDFFSFKPFLLIDEKIIFSLLRQGEENARLFALDVSNGRLQWQKQLKWSRSTHLAGLLNLQEKVSFLDWSVTEENAVEFVQIEPDTGVSLNAIPAIQVNSTAIDMFGAKSSTSSGGSIYLCQKNKGIYQVGSVTSSKTVEPFLMGNVQQVASHKDTLYIHMWENGKPMLFRKNGSQKGDRYQLPLQEKERIASIIPMETQQKQASIVILLEGRKGIALMDFAGSGWKWHINDGCSRFDSAVWTPYGIACIVNTKKETGYTSEILLLDEETGETRSSVALRSPDNWLSWHDGFLLASNLLGLHQYKLFED